MMTTTGTTGTTFLSASGRGWGERIFCLLVRQKGTILHPWGRIADMTLFDYLFEFIKVDVGHQSPASEVLTQ